MKKIIIIALSLFVFNFAFASFGISPPRFINHELKQGDSYEQTIFLSRGTPDSDLKAIISLDTEIDDWFTIKPSQEFLLPEGENQVPMVVRVDVPQDAYGGNYQGIINVSTAAPETGGVGISLGVAVRVDLTVEGDPRPEETEEENFSVAYLFLGVFFLIIITIIVLKKLKKNSF